MNQGADTQSHKPGAVGIEISIWRARFLGHVGIRSGDEAGLPIRHGDGTTEAQPGAQAAAAQAAGKEAKRSPTIGARAKFISRKIPAGGKPDLM
jgi:hypothetical protein